MGNLSEKLVSEKEKPLLTETTLTDDDLVFFHPKYDDLYLIRGDNLYLIKKKFSKINPSDSKVHLKSMAKPLEAFRREFQPYKGLRKP